MPKDPLNSDSFIDDLVSNLTPVQRVKSGALYTLWFVITILINIYFLNLVGVREDIWIKLNDWQYALALTLFGIGFVLASWFAFAIAIPGQTAKKPKQIIVGLAALSSFAVFLYAGLASPDHAHTEMFDSWEALGCCLRISYGALFPTIVLIFLLKKLSPVQPSITVGIGLWASMISISIISQLNCPIDNVFHVLIGHGLLLIVSALISYLVFMVLVRKYVRWYERRKLSNELKNKYDKV